MEVIEILKEQCIKPIAELFYSYAWIILVIAAFGLFLAWIISKSKK